eukprot:c2048_g1_i1.p1 GENE.c2048_g1_i1~~c2048_g1_i1.p1  ORF type:complete len:329 (-),score=91.13 c2048_g1_i1:174-1112(-)
MSRLVLFASCLFGAALSLSPPMPAFLWSENENFLKPGSHESTTSFSSSSLVDLVKSFVGAAQTPSEFADFLPNQAGKAPAIAVVFVYPELQTSQVSVMSRAFDRSSEGGSFKNLKSNLESSTSSVSLPYVFNTDKAFVPAIEGVRGVHVVDSDDAPAFLHANSRLFDSHQTNVVVVSFGAPPSGMSSEEKLNRNDELVGQILRKVKSSVGDSYVALVTANHPGFSTAHYTLEQQQQALLSISGASQTKKSLKSSGSSSSSNSSSNVLYMFPSVLTGLLVGLLLLIITWVGVSGLLGLTTPDSFETGTALAGQ